MNRLPIVLAATALCAVALAGDYEKAHDADEADAAMMQAMQMAATPGEAHAKLANSAGSFTASMLMYMEPDAEPIPNTMTVEREMDLGGRVLVEHWSGDVMGMAFEGRSRTGYDNVTKRYWSTWSDNMSTGLLIMHGGWDDDEQALVMTGKGTHPLSGETYTVRSIGRTTADGLESMDMYEDHGDGEYKSMSFTLQPK
ncbi:MAG: DUF1579 family protein [Pseudomonadota bacterium]